MTLPRTAAAGWDLAGAEAHLLSLERFGMRFGLERMLRLTSTLGRPQDAYRSVHVVGSNGKSSTARMIAGILEREGVSTGTYLSPHLQSFTERIRIGERDLEPAAFAQAVARAARAAALVERGTGGEAVTQFELLTAAALDELARRRVDAAVLEAGLGGRFDATNVVAAPVVALTNVGLEHQRWLGPTILDIAREKLAVLGPGATLVVGDLHPDADAEARRHADAQGAELIVARPRPADPAPGALGGFQRENLAVAREAAGAWLRRPASTAALRGAATDVLVPGRLERVHEDPPIYHDGAHNVEGMRALVGSLPTVLDGRPLVAVVSILDDKDAAAMLDLLLPYCCAVVFCASANPRALPPATLASLAGQIAGVAAPAIEVVPDPSAAHARATARAQDVDGAVLACGSLYLLADLRRGPGAGPGRQGSGR